MSIPTDYAHDLCEYNEATRAIERVLKTLTQREQVVLSLRYGLHDGFVYTLEEVARVLMITRERVRQVEANGLRKLQHPVRIKRLEPHLDAIMRGRPEPPHTPHLDELSAIGPVAIGTDHLASMLCVSRSTARSWVTHGLPKHKFAGNEAFQFELPEVADWLETYHARSGSDNVKRQAAQVARNLVERLQVALDGARKQNCNGKGS